MRLIPRSSWIRWSLLLLLACVAIASLALWRAASRVPEFYADRLVVEAAGPTEEQLQDLQTALTADGPWRIAFTEEEINAWLANDVKKQFPRAIPPYVTEPRIRFNDGSAQVACQYAHEELVAVLSAKVHLETIDRVNSVVMKVTEPKIGSVPGPGSMALDQLRMVAARAGLRVVWRNATQPIGEITLPPKVINTINQITITEIAIEQGRMVVAGSTEVLVPPTPLPPPEKPKPDQGKTSDAPTFLPTQALR